MGSWKTTLAGITTILAAVGPLVTKVITGVEITPAEWTAASAAITAGLGLIFAKDGNKK